MMIFNLLMVMLCVAIVAGTGLAYGNGPVFERGSSPFDLLKKDRNSDVHTETSSASTAAFRKSTRKSTMASASQKRASSSKKQAISLPADGPKPEIPDSKKTILLIKN